MQFKDKETAKVAQGQMSRKLPQQIQAKALRLIQRLDAATCPEDMMNPPGNRWKILKDDRQGDYSVRINNQWRLCWAWEKGPVRVEITDYH